MEGDDIARDGLVNEKDIKDFFRKWKEYLTVSFDQSAGVCKGALMTMHKVTELLSMSSIKNDHFVKGNCEYTNVYNDH